MLDKTHYTDSTTQEYVTTHSVKDNILDKVSSCIIQRQQVYTWEWHRGELDNREMNLKRGEVSKWSLSPTRTIFKGGDLYCLIRNTISRVLLEDILLPGTDCIYCISSNWPSQLGSHLLIITLKLHDLFWKYFI